MVAASSAASSSLVERYMSSKKPPEKRTPEWDKACRAITRRKGHKRPFCGLAGGRRYRDKYPCESPYIQSNGLCRMHGGAALKGAEHPNFKHGRATQAFNRLPKRFKESYTASLTDDDLLSLRVDIAISDARINELLEYLDTGENPKRWGQVALTSHAIMVELAKSGPDLEVVAKLMMDIDGLATASKADDSSWRELRTQSAHGRALRDTERQRLKDMHAYMTAEEALTVVQRLTDTIIRHVEDKTVLQAILHEITTLIGHDSQEQHREELKVS